MTSSTQLTWWRAHQRSPWMALHYRVAPSCHMPSRWASPNHSSPHSHCICVIQLSAEFVKCRPLAWVSSNYMDTAGAAHAVWVLSFIKWLKQFSTKFSSVEQIELYKMAEAVEAPTKGWRQHMAQTIANTCFKRHLANVVKRSNSNFKCVSSIKPQRLSGLVNISKNSIKVTAAATTV